MGTSRLILCALWGNSLAVTATADTTIIRPGPCASQGVYLLAGNSGALIRVNAKTPDKKADPVIVFRQHASQGWASRRLLSRFDLQLEDGGPRIVNSGAFCVEEE